MTIHFKINGKVYLFSLFTSEEFIKILDLNTEKTQRNLSEIRNIVRSKYEGDDRSAIDALLKSVPRVTTQIVDEMFRLAGSASECIEEELSDEDFSFLEKEKISPERVVKLLYLPKNSPLFSEDDIKKVEPVLFKKLNEFEESALSIDVEKNPGKIYSSVETLSKTMCVEKKKADEIYKIFPFFYLVAGAKLRDLTQAEIEVSIKKS